MPAPRLSLDVLEGIHQRALAGESVASLAREYGVSNPGLHLRLQRRYQFKGDPFAPQTISIPADVGRRAYIAGLIDGEGSFGLVGGKTPLLKIAMTNATVIEWLGQMGGRTYTRERSGNRQTIYIWILARSRDLTALVEAVMPYLQVKKAQAQDALSRLQSRR